jgi:hypothetical protein
MEAVVALALIFLGLLLGWALFTGKITFPFGGTA